MNSLIYDTGTVTVSAGSAIVTGNLTGWAVALVEGGMFSCDGLSIPVLSVEDDTHLTLAYNWPGDDGSGKTYAISRTPSEATARAATWTVDRLAKLAQTPWGVGVVPDGRGTLAQRDALDPMPTDDFCWLRVEVDEPAELYFRDGGVWLGPYEMRGEQGTAGVGDGGYGLPAGGTTGQVPKKSSGVDGDVEWGTAGDVVGPDGATDGEIVLMDGPTGDKIKGSGKGINDLLPADKSITNTKLADMATARIKGRATAGTGAPEDLTAAQVMAMLSAAPATRATIGGTANAITLTSPVVLATGCLVRFRATAANTGAATIALNGGSAIACRTIAGVALPAGYVRADVDTTAVYDGTYWVLGREDESGSNANGSYERRADGWQKCRSIALSQTVTESSGAFYRTSSDAVWTFPAAFSSVPSIVGNCAVAARWLTCYTISASEGRCRQYSGGSSSTGVDSFMVAEGWWY